MKHSLALAYGSKRPQKVMGKESKTCPDCMASGGKCMAHGGKAKGYAEGGEVDAKKPLKSKPQGKNFEMEETKASASMAPHELVDQDMRSSEDSSDDQEDLPHIAKSLSLAAEIMMDRKRRMMANGGAVEDYEGEDTESSPRHVGDDEGPIDAPDKSYLTEDEDELDAPKEDGRDSRGLNAEPVHSMEDDEHDSSEASLVSEILKDRKSRRRG
jgi:hypothetical protein